MAAKFMYLYYTDLYPLITYTGLQLAFQTKHKFSSNPENIVFLKTNVLYIQFIIVQLVEEIFHLEKSEAEQNTKLATNCPL